MCEFITSSHFTSLHGVYAYRPGSDSYAYDNPWPKLNGGRLDWLFGDGWRRPLAKDQGAKMVEFYFFSLVLKIIIFGVTKFSRRSQLIVSWFAITNERERKEYSSSFSKQTRKIFDRGTPRIC